jgi:hypothetical protein
MEDRANVIEFPVKITPPLCSNCDHAALSSYGVYCMLFNENIMSETVAAECEEFDPQ